MESPFLDPDPLGYPSSVTNAVVELLAHAGSDRLSVRAVAAPLGVSPAAVLKGVGGRSGFVELLAREFGARWLAWAAQMRLNDELPLRLPRTDAERHGVRVHAVLEELVRGEDLTRGGCAPGLWRTVRGLERSGLEFELSRRLGRRPEREEVAAVQALGVGLRLGVMSGDIESGHAEELLRSQVERLPGWNPARLVSGYQPGTVHPLVGEIGMLRWADRDGWPAAG